MPHPGPPSKSYPNGPPEIGDSAGLMKYNYERSRQTQQEKKKAEQDAEAAEAARKSGGDLGTLPRSQNPADYTNPQFHPNIYTGYNPENGIVQRGFMRQAREYTEGMKVPAVTLKFLYNPNDVNVSYSNNRGAFPPYKWDPADTATLLVPNMQQIAFSLYFDRMYELAYLNFLNDDMAAHKEKYAKGVRADIEVLENLVGIVNGIGGVMPIPLDLYFGITTTGRPERGQRTGPRNVVARPLRFYGWIASMSVAYAQFSATMTPMRARVDVTFAQLARPIEADKDRADPLSEDESTTGAFYTEVSDK